MAMTFKDLREKTKEDETVEVKTAGVNTSLPTDSDELEDADENQRNADDESAEGMVVTAFKPIYKKNEYGIYTLASESALQEEMELVENAVDDLKKVVARHQAGKIKFKSGGSIRVDVQTANALLQVHGALNSANQVKMVQLIAKDSSGFNKMTDFAWKQLRIAKSGGLQGANVGALMGEGATDK